LRWYFLEWYAKYSDSFSILVHSYHLCLPCQLFSVPSLLVESRPHADDLSLVGPTSQLFGWNQTRSEIGSWCWLSITLNSPPKHRVFWYISSSSNSARLHPANLLEIVLTDSRSAFCRASFQFPQ
jgi:hypothetical protein